EALMEARSLVGITMRDHGTSAATTGSDPQNPLPVSPRGAGARRADEGVRPPVLFGLLRGGPGGWNSSRLAFLDLNGQGMVIGAVDRAPFEPALVPQPQRLIANPAKSPGGLGEVRLVPLERGAVPLGVQQRHAEFELLPVGLDQRAEELLGPAEEPPRLVE